MPMMLNPNCFYDNGNFSGKLSKEFRCVAGDGTIALNKMLTQMQAVLTAAGAAAQATAAGTLLTYFGTPSNVDLIVEKF